MHMKLSFEEEQLLKSLKILDKDEVIKKLKNMKTEDSSIDEIVRSLLNKVNNTSQIDLEKSIMNID